MKNNITRKLTHPYLLLKVFILTVLLLSTSPIIVSADFKWDIKDIEGRIYKDTEYKDVLERFHQDKEVMKQDNPSLYYYVSGINDIVENNFQKAENNLLEAVAYSRAEKLIEIEIASLKQLVVISDFYMDTGRLLEYGSRLLEIAEEYNDHETEMFSYKVLATVMGITANGEKALEYVEIIATLAYEYDSPVYGAVHHMLVGHFSFFYLDLEKALSSYEEADKWFEQSNDVEAANMQTLNRAHILLTKSFLFRGDMNSILQEMDLLIEEAKKRYNHASIVYNLYVIKGQIQQQFDLKEEAIRTLEESKLLFDKINHVDNANDIRNWLLLHLANAYYQNEDYKESADMYSEVAVVDLSQDHLKNMDDVTAKLREFLERDLNNQIITLTELKEAQNKALIQQRIILLFSVIGFFVLIRAFVVKRREHRKVTNLKDKLFIQSITDNLTGVYNRKHIFELLDSSEEGTVIALIDIDNFKLINDKLGYLVGDEVLKKVVQTIKDSIREGDVIGRYGGEEFLLLLKNTEIEDAIIIVERIRKKVEEIEWDYEGLITTISIGVSERSDYSTEEVFRQVDNLVHEAKRTGKNKLTYKHA
ncbi:GGDEF domain-containing protein [Bacillus alkalicellulosilyticus]|uniref:GGDEF domain-containing protein n=1 Tax=Alkalihalobacterium alkalicellulosilyticum TaxID=1912214 RepID=UPI0009974B48|nr:GGDEF domain-containing protein [Bacillus alkalicellulosilyticus]